MTAIIVLRELCYDSCCFAIALRHDAQRQSEYVSLIYALALGDSFTEAHWHIAILSWLQMNLAPQMGHTFSFI